MAKKVGVTSNFVKFNKNQKKLIDRFNLGVASSIGQVMVAAMTLARESGIERIEVPSIAEKHPPLKIGGRYIYNPIWSKKDYKEVKEKKDTSKVLDRTGTLRRAFDFFARFPIPNALSYSEKEETHYIVLDSVGNTKRVRIGFLGNAAMSLNNVTKKDAWTRLRGRRRFVEKSFSRVKSIFKKLMMQKRLTDTKALK